MEKISELENKIPDVSGLVSLTKFATELKKVDDKVSLNKIKLDDTDSAYFRGKNYFTDHCVQNYLVFQCVYKYFKRVIDSTNNNNFYWQSKGLPNEKLNAPGTNTSNDHDENFGGDKINLQFSGDCLKQNKVTYSHGKIVNIYIDSRGSFTHPDSNYGVNVIIFGCDLSNSGHASNRANTIIILGRSLVQELNGKTLYAEKMYSPNFTVTNQTFTSSLQYNGDDSYLLVNGKEVTKIKAKDIEIKPYPLCLGNISKGISSTNVQNTGLHGYAYDFSVDYGAISNDKILDIHKYLVKKKIYKCLGV